MSARPEEDIAWAAGIFDGEGSTSTYIPKKRNGPRRQMALSQGGPHGQHPPVLTRFQQIVGIGNVTGPYRDGLYYWKTTRMEGVDAVGAMLWPYLSREKRAQFAAAAIRMKRAIPGPLGVVGARPCDAAWAAGLFDGEGTFGAYASARMRPSWRGVSMSIPQASATVVPEPLIRFRAAVGVGTVTGPRIVPSPWSRLPQYRWQARGRHVCSAAIKVIWPWLGPVKRTEIGSAIAHLAPNVEVWMNDLTA
jgi:hypothetical protein